MKTNSSLPGSAFRLNRSQAGSSLVEVLCALCMLVPFLLLALDACVLVSATNLNETVCRNAARAASMGAPDALKKGEPEKNALGIITSANSDAGYVRIMPAVSVTENVVKPLPVAPFGGPVNGEVTVTTTAQVDLPFTSKVLRRGPVHLTAKQVYAYSFVLPAQATSLKN